MLGGNTAYYDLPITVHGHVDAVTCKPSNWTTLIEVDITIPDSMYIYSFGTVSGAGWYDSHKMLQISIYDESYSNFNKAEYVPFIMRKKIIMKFIKKKQVLIPDEMIRAEHYFYKAGKINWILFSFDTDVNSEKHINKFML